MPRSIVSVPTSQNIVYQPNQAAISDPQLAIVGNQNKYMKNVSGALAWSSISADTGLPDPNTVTADKDSYVLCFNFATKTFLVRRALVYMAPRDVPGLTYLFVFSPANISLTGSALNSVSNIAPSGSSYVISVPNGNGTNTYSLGPGNYGLNIPQNKSLRVAGGGPRTANYAYTFFYTANSNSSNWISFARTWLNSSAAVTSNLWLVSPGGNGFIFQTNPSVQVSSTNAYPAYGTYIVSFLQLNGTGYIYYNGLLIASGASASPYYSSTPEDIVIFGIPANNIFYGTAYAMGYIDNATLSSLQKLEGALKWNSDISNASSWPLDISHPYHSAAPGF